MWLSPFSPPKITPMSTLGHQFCRPLTEKSRNNHVFFTESERRRPFLDMVPPHYQPPKANQMKPDYIMSKGSWMTDLISPSYWRKFSASYLFCFFGHYIIFVRLYEIVIYFSWICIFVCKMNWRNWIWDCNLFQLNDLLRVLNLCKVILNLFVYEFFK